MNRSSESTKSFRLKDVETSYENRTEIMESDKSLNLLDTDGKIEEVRELDDIPTREDQNEMNSPKSLKLNDTFSERTIELTSYASNVELRPMESN